MRLRRRADRVRAAGWLNLGIATLIFVVDPASWDILAAWSIAVMATTYAWAHRIDAKAERVVTR